MQPGRSSAASSGVVCGVPAVAGRRSEDAGELDRVRQLAAVEPEDLGAVVSERFQRGGKRLDRRRLAGAGRPEQRDRPRAGRVSLAELGEGRARDPLERCVLAVDDAGELGGEARDREQRLGLGLDEGCAAVRMSGVAASGVGCASASTAGSVVGSGSGGSVGAVGSIPNASAIGPVQKLHSSCGVENTQVPVSKSSFRRKSSARHSPGSTCTIMAPASSE